MIVVLDTSVAIEVTLQRDKEGALVKIIQESDWLIAPSLFVSEVSNVFWKYHQFSQYSLADCEKNIEQALALPDDYINDIELYREAFNLSCMLEHPVYDMLYLVLARRNNATLLSLDKKLNRAAHKTNVKTAHLP
ncbi:MAG: type II toxin-antitoxin system VapC family toxin [gamma proteobacterium symbiont of Taylorina sp.]|nr:type II toxin-antitoxin system VapC family toxin [gamma proteobacterium symbiont of Taylorina sp.]